MKPTPRKNYNFSITCNADILNMVNFIMEETGITTRSQCYNMSIRQMYLTLKADKAAKEL